MSDGLLGGAMVDPGPEQTAKELVEDLARRFTAKIKAVESNIAAMRRDLADLNDAANVQKNLVRIRNDLAIVSAALIHTMPTMEPPKGVDVERLRTMMTEHTVTNDDLRRAMETVSREMQAGMGQLAKELRAEMRQIARR